MSASTLSITANPGARRRQVVVTEQKRNTNFELFPSAAADGEAADAVQGRDLSHHLIRGEAMVERTSKEAAQVKKTSSTISPRRIRKAAVAERNEKPRWLTVVSVLFKNFVLLLVILGLVQLVRKIATSSENGEAGEHLGFVDFEDRIAGIDSSMKKTAKLMQVQMEVIDKKVDSIDRKIVDKGTFLEGELRKLAGRTEGLERSIGELRREDWLSKKEFEKIYKELKKGGEGGRLGGGDVSLDDIRAYARDLVEREIEKHAADGLGRVDYALASSGGVVLRHSEPYLAWKGGNWLLMAARGGVHPDAVKILKPSFGEPGQCFPLKGSSGFVEIRLRKAITPEAITLEHVSKSVAYDRSSAPNVCSVSGWRQGHFDSGMPVETTFLLAEFIYDLEKSNAQTFDVRDPSSVGLVDTVRLDFVSNHGSLSHTCIYRLRVHGHEPDVSQVIVAKD